jgi:hypothetical protein
MLRLDFKYELVSEHTYIYKLILVRHFNLKIYYGHSNHVAHGHGARNAIFSQIKSLGNMAVPSESELSSTAEWCKNEWTLNYL